MGFISVTIECGCDEQDFLKAVRLDGLLQFNMKQTGGKLLVPDKEIVYTARDSCGTIIGGVSGSAYLSALEVEVLWVHESCRGQHIASQLLERAEVDARRAGCILAHLTTYSFQAPLFYQKQGYTLCGEIDGFPDGIRLCFLKKTL